MARRKPRHDAPPTAREFIKRLEDDLKANAADELSWQFRSQVLRVRRRSDNGKGDLAVVTWLTSGRSFLSSYYEPERGTPEYRVRIFDRESKDEEWWRDARCLRVNEVREFLLEWTRMA